MGALADSAPETQVQETSMPPPPAPPIQVASEDADNGPSAPIAEELPSRVKKTFAKILYQCEVNIDPSNQDAKVKEDIMRYVSDNLKLEYKFDGKPLFVFSPMNVTDTCDGNTPRREENLSPFSFTVEGIKTSENWDYGKYETNMMIQLKKRRRGLVAPQAESVQQDDPEQDKCGPNEKMETEMAQVEEKWGPFKKTFGNHFQSIAFGMVIALLVGLAVGLIYFDFTE